MIYEYALDPTILKDWGSFRPLADGFGFSKGRVIAAFPKDWRRLAFTTIDAIETTDPIQDQKVKYKFKIWLHGRAKSAMSGIRRSSANNDGPTWFINALAEHSRGPFHAVISDQPSKENPPVLDYHDADESHPLWRANDKDFVARTASEIGPRVGRLLVHSREIRFIDPYFKAAPEQLPILFSCLECFKTVECLVEKIELHVAGNKVSQKMVSYLLRDISGGCPPGLREKIHVVRWKEGYLHNRFILTNRGGIMFGDSFLESGERPDQLNLLKDKDFEAWWNRHDAARMSAYLMAE